MSTGAKRRLEHLRAVLSPDGKQPHVNSNTVAVGDVSLEIVAPRCPELVPYVSPPFYEGSSEILGILRWMMQKDKLGQDMFLIGPPGPLKAQIVAFYAQLTRREVEYVAVSRDTTDSDLKQRREIVNGTAVYYDQACVRAAIHGRILILDGVEKAERNVLPILNNLLENREMSLDDGRFLASPTRFDSLVQSGNLSPMAKSKLIRVSERFIVIALGVPVPKYEGLPLDPPFRSRFQCRNIPHPQLETLTQHIQRKFSRISPNTVYQLVSSATVLMNIDDSEGTAIPEFPWNLERLASVTSQFSSHSQDIGSVLQYSYPFPLIGTLESTAVTSIASILEQFGSDSLVKDASFSDSSDNMIVTIKSDPLIGKVVEINGSTLPIPCGSLSHTKATRFISTKLHDHLLRRLFIAHTSGDICVIGEKGVGKSILIRCFAQNLGYEVEYVPLYKDMSARDLLQRRVTTNEGDTSWEHSGLIQAALSGSLAILDPIDVLPFGVLSSIQQLVHQREINLPDGSRLINSVRYSYLLRSGLTPARLKEAHIYPIHPSFRIVAVARPVSTTPLKSKWLTAEIASMFLFVPMRVMTYDEELLVVQGTVNLKSQSQQEKIDNITHRLLELANSFRSHQDDTLKNLAMNLSTRSLIRIAKKLRKDSTQEDLGESIRKACLYPFLPPVAKTSLDKFLSTKGLPMLETNATASNLPDLKIEIVSRITSPNAPPTKFVRIGKVEHPIETSTDPRLVPNIQFFENARQTKILQDILLDYMNGEHVLLIGNQGVGKNKIVDKFLQLLNLPREYIQLHRDTTVYSLTCNPAVVDGRLVYEDSSLVKAVKFGYILVVDEADKAPTHVTAVLKSLIEDQEMILADGRRIISSDHPKAMLNLTDDRYIIIHPRFRLFALANRPGFPFLGNDFFREIGDVFATHCVENPDDASELAMLRKYAPSVSNNNLSQFIGAFGELRRLVDEGTITYPYSTRELVNILRHLEAFPNEGTSRAFQNVFDFDTYDKETRDILRDVMSKYGVPVGLDSKFNIDLAQVSRLPGKIRLESWKAVNDQEIVLDPTGDNFSMRGEWKLQVGSSKVEKLSKIEARSSTFSEKLFSFQLPSKGSPLDAIQSRHDGKLYVITVNPVALHVIESDFLSCRVIQLYEFIPLSNGVQLSLVEFQNELVIIHNSIEHTLIRVDLKRGLVSTQVLQGFDPIFESFLLKLPCGQLVIVYQKENGRVCLIDFNRGQTFMFTTGQPLTGRLLALNGETIVFQTSSGRLTGRFINNRLHILPMIREYAHKTGPSHLTYSATSGPNSFSFTTTFPPLYLGSGEIRTSTSPELEMSGWIRDLHAPMNHYLNLENTSLYLEKSNLFVNVIPNKTPSVHDAFLEIIDPGTGIIRTRIIPARIPWDAVSTLASSPSSKSAMHRIIPSMLVVELAEGNLFLLDHSGLAQIMQVRIDDIELHLKQWKAMTGLQVDSALKLVLPSNHPLGQENDEEDSNRGLSAIEIPGEQGSGGSQGSGDGSGAGEGENGIRGGSGGFGGPANPIPDPEGRKSGKLDANFHLREVNEIAKQVTEAQMDLHKRRLKSRLESLNMNDKDMDTFLGYKRKVQKQIQDLRAILESVEAKNKERIWLRNRVSGDLDETKLVEGIAGDKTIFKLRGENEDDIFQEKPKRMIFVFDLSASMLRFNGHDSRMDRSMECAVMLMEAFRNYEHKFSYQITGHSGDGPRHAFTKDKKFPKNEKEIFDIVAKMSAHAAYCMSGDSTLEAITTAIDEVVKEDGDDYFVIVLSDANLNQYNISTQAISHALKKNPKVNAHIVFIGNISNQAANYSKNLPGNAFVCLDTNDLPKIIKSIFQASMLK